LTPKKRLDVAVHEKGLAESREKARALIMAGRIYVNGNKAVKSGMPVKEDDAVEIRGAGNPFVSRGGLKLQKAIINFGINPEGLVCLDIGASTGGFTDCMLSLGAKKVYAVDVGYGQLAWKLRNDNRVVNLERTNFRYVTTQQIPEPVDFAGIDVSFISLTLILPVLRPLLAEGGTAVCLIKPQFEAGKDRIGKKGVVRDASVHAEVINNIVSFACGAGYSVQKLDYSPIKGPEGNIEYLMMIKKDNRGERTDEQRTGEIVEQSHKELDGGERE